MGENNTFVLDVFIRDERIDRVKHYIEHVTKLFHVDLLFASPTGKQFMPVAGHWLDIHGEKKNVMKAREYVKGLSAPEEVIRLRFPPPVYELICGKDGEKVYQLEQETAANVAFNSLEDIEISGSISGVTEASSTVERIIKTFIEENSYFIEDDSSSSIGGRDSGIFLKCNHSPDYIHDNHSDFSYENRISVLTIDEDLSEETNIELSRDSLLGKDETKCNCADWSEQNLLTSDLMEYARKLGYSDSQVKSAMKKLGPDTVHQNDLLHELIKVANSQRDGRLLGEKGAADFSSFYESFTDASAITDTKFLRHIVVDGSNVAMSHGNDQVFSCRGIAIVVNWFQKRGHAVTVFVPNWRNEVSKPSTPIKDQDILTKLREDGVISFTPSRRIDGKLIQCYDDRYIIRLAVETDGIVVSNDHFRDIQREMHEWKDFINKRLLMYTFVGDIFMPPDDPLGRHGPTLNEFLKKNVEKRSMQYCPYGKKCTFGPKCKFFHPERRHSGSFVKKPLPPLPKQVSQASGSRPRSDPGQNVACTPDGKQRPISLPNLEQLYVSPPHSLHRYIYVQNNNFQRPVSGPPFSENNNPLFGSTSDQRPSVECIQQGQNRKFTGEYQGQYNPQYIVLPTMQQQQNMECIGRPLSSDFSSRPSSGEYSYGSSSRPQSGEYGNNSRPSSGEYGAVPQYHMGVYQRSYNSHSNFYPMKNFYKTRNTPTLPETKEEPRQPLNSLKIDIVEKLRQLYPDQYDTILWVLRNYPDVKCIEDAIPIMNECLNS